MNSAHLATPRRRACALWVSRASKTRGVLRFLLSWAGLEREREEREVEAALPASLVWACPETGGCSLTKL